MPLGRLCISSESETARASRRRRAPARSRAIDRLAWSDAKGFKPSERRRVSKAGRIVDHECVQTPEEAGRIHVRDLCDRQRVRVDGWIGKRHRDGTIRFLPGARRRERTLVLEIVNGRGVPRSVDLCATKQPNEIRRGFDRWESRREAPSSTPGPMTVNAPRPLPVVRVPRLTSTLVHASRS